VGGGEISLGSPSAMKWQRVSWTCSINFPLERCVSTKGTLSNREPFVAHWDFHLCLCFWQMALPRRKVAMSFTACNSYSAAKKIGMLD
jgi:hypothetical protein